MPALSSTTEFLDLLRQSGIHHGDALDQTLTMVPDLPEDPGRAAAVLVQRGLLTRFQARLLLNGRSKGFRLGPYVIQDQLGQGGMGTVFLAAHTTLRRQVALKVLTPPKDADDVQMAVERFVREARAAAALDHPNIVRIHDIAQQGNLYYLGLEYVDGPTLDQLLQKGGPITPSRAVGYIAQAAAGLQHADERGFVHRDIKPANLILTKDQKVLKILDMGLARSFNKEEDKLTERLDNGVVTGTVDYIAPEQSLGCSEIDTRADIYSLGATFFALIAGVPPFQGNTTQKLAQHQMKPAPNLSELDPTLPRELAAVVAKMLAKKPKDRYQTPGAVIAALAPWLGNSRTNIVGGPALGDAPTERREPTTDGADGPSQAGQNTVSKDASNTARRTTRRKKLKAAAAQRKKTLLVVGSVLGVVLAGIVGGVLAFGGSKKPEVTASVAPAGSPSVTPPAVSPASSSPKTNPPRTPAPGVKPPVGPTGALLYHGDFLGLEPGSRSVPIGEKVFAQQLGGQNLPLGWAVNHHETTAAADYMIADVSGVRALGIRHVQGGRTEVLCRLDAVTGGSLGINESRTFRVVYQFEGTGTAQVGVKLDRDPYTKHVLEPLVKSNENWQQAEFTFTRTNADPVVLICTIASDPKAPGTPAGTVWIRSVDVWAGRAATASANRFAEWKAGAVVYKPDLSAIQPFRATKEGAKLQTGTPERLPKGVRAGCWKPTATAEFRCEPTDGSRALGLTNLTDEKSGQITFELEREMNLHLTPGKVYRVTVGYTTRNDAFGGLMVQVPNAAGFRTVSQVPLAAADGTWKTASGEFERQDGDPIRLSLENFSAGEGNTLYIRSIEITELVKPS